jgi:hypothetical protein
VIRYVFPLFFFFFFSFLSFEGERIGADACVFSLRRRRGAPGA